MPRIDDSHTPFKRKRTLGPGPKKHPKIAQTKMWKCEKPSKKKKGFYTQLCVYVPTGSVHTVRVKVAKKKAYNKVYRAWLKRNAARAAASNRPALRAYTCRRTRTAKCR